MKYQILFSGENQKNILKCYLLMEFLPSMLSFILTVLCKTCLQEYADSDGPDQPAHLHSMIRAFTVH